LNRLIEAGSIHVSTTASNEDEITEVPLPNLEIADVHASIAAVARAINELLPRGRGITLLNHDGGNRVFPFDELPTVELDPVTLHTRQLEGHTALFLLQRGVGTDYPPAIAYVVDSAPWTLTPAQRTQSHEDLIAWKVLQVDVPGAKEMRSTVPGTLTWTPGPQQTDPEHSPYFAIVSAWAVLLGLPLNTDFAPSTDFYRDVQLMLQAVQHEHANWKLIWAFLRCMEYTGPSDPPPPER
jgi:hypothetical protein